MLFASLPGGSGGKLCTACSSCKIEVCLSVLVILCVCSVLAANTMASDENLKEYTREEVEEHKSAKSCWIIIENKIYDVTKFLEEHPGGLEILLEHAGIDATEDFADVGHSTDALQMRKEYLVGQLVEADRKDFSRPSAWDSVQQDQESSKGGWTNIVVAGICGLIAFLAYRWLTG